MPVKLLPPVGADLSPRQLAFVKTYLQLGGRKGAGVKAAIAAGYSPKSAAHQAWKLLHTPKVIEALHREVATTLKVSGTLGVGVLIDLAQNGSPDSVRFSAAKELAGLAGHALPTLHRHEHEHRFEGMSTEELRAYAARLAQDAGIPLALPSQPVIDVVAEPVEEPKPEPLRIIGRKGARGNNHPKVKAKLAREADAAEPEEWEHE